MFEIASSTVPNRRLDGTSLEVFVHLWAFAADQQSILKEHTELLSLQYRRMS